MLEVDSSRTSEGYMHIAGRYVITRQTALAPAITIRHAQRLQDRLTVTVSDTAIATSVSPSQEFYTCTIMP